MPLSGQSAIPAFREAAEQLAAFRLPQNCVREVCGALAASLNALIFNGKKGKSILCRALYLTAFPPFLFQQQPLCPILDSARLEADFSSRWSWLH